MTVAMSTSEDIIIVGLTGPSSVPGAQGFCSCPGSSWLGLILILQPRLVFTHQSQFLHVPACIEGARLTLMSGKSWSMAFRVAALFRICRCSSSALCTMTAWIASPTCQFSFIFNACTSATWRSFLCDSWSAFLMQYPS